jgi:chemotaxis family two-component system response regulator Rcp1
LPSRPKILLVDDNPGDAHLAMMALRLVKFGRVVDHASDGLEALERLRADVATASSHKISLVLADINMPRMNGRELLARIKSDITLRLIPVVMLTTSQSEREATFCYELGASLVLTKHVDFDAFLGVIQELKDFWETCICGGGGPALDTGEA